MTHEAVIIWHNPQCSKSRQTLKLLQDQGIAPRIVKYLETPPAVSELEQALTALGCEPRQLLRTGESLYKELGLANPALDRAQLIALMAAHPRLIERPVVFVGARAVIGRPAENVLPLLA